MSLILSYLSTAEGLLDGRGRPAARAAVGVRALVFLEYALMALVVVAVGFAFRNTLSSVFKGILTSVGDSSSTQTTTPGNSSGTDYTTAH